MNSNRLKLNSEKTQFIWLGSRHELVRISTTSINLGACTVDFLKTVNDLGVTIDCQLSMKDHVQRVCTTAYYHLRQLRSIRGSLSADSCSTLVRAFITSRIDYCNSLLAGVDKSQVGKLQSILRVAARLIMRKRKFDPISDDIRDKLHWLPVEQRSNSRLGCWSTDVSMGTLHPTHRRCSLQRRMSLVVDRFDQLPMGTWSFPALELLDMAQGCSPSLVHLSGTHFLSDCGTSA